MKSIQVELFITNGDKQETIILDNSPVLIGSSNNCSIQTGDGEPKIKAVIQKQTNLLLIKAFDNSFAIDINGKKYKSAKIKKSVFLKIAHIDIVVSVEELVTQAPISNTTPSINDELPDFLDDESSPEALSVNLAEVTGKINIPDIPALKTREPRPVVAVEDVAITDVKVKDKESYFNFNIEFDNTLELQRTNASYLDSLCFDKYIDPKDETMKELPSKEITIDGKGFCAQVIHQNNGTVLESEFFDLKLKKLFISNGYSDDKTVKIHDCNKKREEILYVRDNKVQVVSLAGYEAQKISSNETVETIEGKTTQLIKNERIVFTKGTSQIIIKLVAFPPTLRKNSFFSVDERLLKNIFVTWAMFIIPILITFLVVDIPKPEKKIKKELVVIYKKKASVNKKPTDMPPSEKLASSPSKQKEPQKLKTDQPAKPVVDKKVTKKIKAKKINRKKLAKLSPVVKKSLKKKTLSKVKSKKIAKKKYKTRRKATVPKVAKKSYSFNSTSLMSAALGTSTTQFEKIKDKSSNTAANLGSSKSISKSFDSKQFGNSKNKIGRFAAGDKHGKSNVTGTKGLSGKSGSSTAYMEASTKILGAMDPELIRKIMREHIPDFRYCYQRELMINSEVAGVFDITFKINKYGKGVNVGVKNNGKSFSSNAKKCLSRVVSMIKFPRPKGGGTVDVKQPMNFSNI